MSTPSWWLLKSHAETANIVRRIADDATKLAIALDWIALSVLHEVWP